MSFLYTFRNTCADYRPQPEDHKTRAKCPPKEEEQVNCAVNQDDRKCEELGEVPREPDDFVCVTLDHVVNLTLSEVLPGSRRVSQLLLENQGT
jgi:hypothetical protein